MKECKSSKGRLVRCCEVKASSSRISSLYLSLFHLLYFWTILREVSCCKNKCREPHTALPSKTAILPAAFATVHAQSQKTLPGIDRSSPVMTAFLAAAGRFGLRGSSADFRLEGVEEKPLPKLGLARRVWQQTLALFFTPDLCRTLGKTGESL